MATEAQEIVHVPAPGRGQGFYWTSVCGQPMVTDTGDVAPMQREARAIAIGAKKENHEHGSYCIDCLLKLSDLRVEECPDAPPRWRYAVRGVDPKKDLILSSKKNPSRDDMKFALEKMLGRLT
jgi:hypothetical protein